MGKNHSKRKPVTEYQNTTSIMRKLDNMLNKEKLAAKAVREKNSKDKN